MNIEDIVEITSEVSHKHYKHVGRITKECNSKFKKMYLVEFAEGDIAKFYESSLRVISLDIKYIQGMYI